MKKLIIITLSLASLILVSSTFTSCKADVDLTDIEQEILAILMTREWVGQQLKSVTNTLQVYSGKETKYYSQAQHLSELRALDESLRLEAQQLSRDYTYVDSEYFDD